MRVADYISEYLAHREVSHVFGVSGANIEDLFESIYLKKKTEVILAKSEYSASTMALGRYLSLKTPSVVLTTSGPGILNTIPVLAEAFTSKIPMIVISGSVPIALEGIGAFQDTSGKGESFDILKMLEPCTCFQKKIQDENEIPNALSMAFQQSIKNKRPAVLLIPKDFFTKDINVSDVCDPIDEIISDLQDLDGAYYFCEEFLKEEKNSPLIILGEELIHLKNPSIILEFVKKTGGRVALTPNSKGLFDHNSPAYLGLIGIMGHDEVNDYLERTEHVIFLGVNFDLLNRVGLSHQLQSKNILIIKEAQSESLFKLEVKTLCSVYGDVDNIISRLSSGIINPKIPINNELCFQEDDSYILKNIIREIETILDVEGNIFIDAGNTGAFVIHHLRARGNGVCYVSLGMGGMGNSIGAGIGSAVSTRKKTYVFLGDGSFLMYGLELHTAKEHNLPITFFILNNNSHGMCTTRENIFLSGTTGINDFKESYFAEGIGKIFPGIAAYEVDDMDKLKMSLSEIANHQSPCVISIKISNDENPPFRTFIKN